MRWAFWKPRQMCPTCGIFESEDECFYCRAAIEGMAATRPIGKSEMDEWRAIMRSYAHKE